MQATVERRFLDCGFPSSNSTKMQRSTFVKSMARTTVLLVDDEPEYLEWLVDFVESIGLTTDSATNAQQALVKLKKNKYQCVVVDMSIPGDPAASSQATRVALADQFPGLAIVQRARNLGYLGRNVVAFTVHDEDAIDEVLKKLDVRYVLKGRPSELKQAVADACRRTHKSKS